MPFYPMKFAFSTENNDRVEAVVTLPKEQRSIIHGTVYDTDGNRLPNAVVRLFRYEENRLLPVADMFTDADGEFVFGPLETDKRFVAKVYVNGTVIREVTIRPVRKRKSG